MGLAARTCTAALAGLALACSAQPQLETRTFELKHLDGGRAEVIITPYVYRERPGAQGMISVAGNVVTVRETTDNLDRIARVLAEVDRPRPTLRPVFKIIEANGKSIRHFGHLVQSLYMIPAGEKVYLTMEREGRQFGIVVPLARNTDLGPLPKQEEIDTSKPPLIPPDDE